MLLSWHFPNEDTFECAALLAASYFQWGPNQVKKGSWNNALDDDLPSIFKLRFWSCPCHARSPHFPLAQNRHPAPAMAWPRARPRLRVNYQTAESFYCLYFYPSYASLVRDRTEATVFFQVQSYHKALFLHRYLFTRSCVRESLEPEGFVFCLHPSGAWVYVFADSDWMKRVWESDSRWSNSCLPAKVRLDHQFSSENVEP